MITRTPRRQPDVFGSRGFRVVSSPEDGMREQADGRLRRAPCAIHARVLSPEHAPTVTKEQILAKLRKFETEARVPSEAKSENDVSRGAAHVHPRDPSPVRAVVRRSLSGIPSANDSRSCPAGASSLATAGRPCGSLAPSVSGDLRGPRSRSRGRKRFCGCPCVKGNQ